jgi:hypothetical protein
MTERPARRSSLRRSGRADRLPREKRRALLLAELARVQEAKEPILPGAFAERCGISKAALRQYPDVASGIHEHARSLGLIKGRAAPRLTASEAKQRVDAAGLRRSAADALAQVARLELELASARRVATDSKAEATRERDLRARYEAAMHQVFVQVVDGDPELCARCEAILTTALGSAT